ncbi:MAG: lauroyl acyltransferase [unclassified Hahellaceae]|nr:lauroyl acyltransferase [Hahellaceae bacterium]|tara:strand:+ start:24603 stop:25412 length:810 start_codon:yes stop_codon:yes gene_type:complete
MIEARNLWKRYGDNVVLERLNIKVQEGDFITMVGASGCGKSTFLKLLLGTEGPSKGELLIDGQPVRQEPGPDRGVVFQKYSVFPHMTVLENVMAAKAFQRKGATGWLFGKAGKAARQEAMAILEQVGLGHTLERYPHQLSGGMQQRLAIAQALLGRPRILLLDEPFGALDPGIRGEMHQLVLSLWREYKLTVFMVTHDLKEGFFLGTRLWVFDRLRHDPHAPDAYGASITYDLPVGQVDPKIYHEIDEEIRPAFAPVPQAEQLQKEQEV